MECAAVCMKVDLLRKRKRDGGRVAKYIAVGAGPIYVPVTVCAAGVRIGVGCRCVWYGM